MIIQASLVWLCFVRILCDMMQYVGSNGGVELWVTYSSNITFREIRTVVKGAVFYFVDYCPVCAVRIRAYCSIILIFRLRFLLLFVFAP